MAVTIYGADPVTAYLTKDRMRWRITANGIEVVKRYQGTEAGGGLPTIGAALGTITVNGVGYTNLICHEIGAAPSPGGGYCGIDVIYRTPESTARALPPVGTVQFEADANPIQIPISQHPTMTDAEKADAIAQGKETYLVPQPTFRRREVVSNFVWTEANIVLSVGAVCAPVGLSSPTAGAWLKSDRSIRQNGDAVEISDAWQYASGGKPMPGWDPKIYPTA